MIDVFNVVLVILLFTLLEIPSKSNSRVLEIIYKGSLQ
jgi:hypothetical protein